MSGSERLDTSSGLSVSHERTNGIDAENSSLGEIVGKLTSDFTDLMRAEIALAKVEVKEEATAAGKGAGMLAGAGVAGHFLLLFASLALMFLLDVWLPIGWAAFVVALLWGAVAAVLASSGKKNLKKATTDPMHDTVQTLKEDAQWAKNPRG
jgi:uncharacterized membrane protein YqjE